MTRQESGFRLLISVRAWRFAIFLSLSCLDSLVSKQSLTKSGIKLAVVTVTCDVEVDDTNKDIGSDIRYWVRVVRQNRFDNN